MTSVANHVDIHQQLEKLWETEGKDKTLARLFNFIIITQKSERTSYYKELVKKVIAKFPSRIFLLIENMNATEDHILPEVTSESVSEEIYCELIQIEAGGKYREQLPYLILPYIVPDLPIYLLWTTPVIEKSHYLKLFQPYISRIIFDPEGATDLTQYARTLHKFVDQFQGNLGDLNWAAISGWREIFAKVFDTPEMFAHLDHLGHLEISYNHYPTPYFKHSEIKAVYFQGWLASRLKWQFQNIQNLGNGKFTLSYKNSLNKPFTLSLTTSKETQLPPGAILSIELESTFNKGHFDFKRHPETHQVFIQFSDSRHCALPQCGVLSGFDPGKEVLEEIFNEKMTSHYKNMLNTISQITWPT